MSDELADDPRPLAVLRSNGSALLIRFPLPFVFGVIVVVASLPSLGTTAGSVSAAVGIAWLAVSILVWRRSRIECFEDRIVFHSTRRRRTLLWTEVISVSIAWQRAGRWSPNGYMLIVVPKPPERRLVWPDGLRREALPDLEQFLRAHAPEVVLNPKEPWRDRFGNWHADHLDEDPIEAIRAVRRAFVGPWIIRAGAVDDGFRATRAPVNDQKHPVEVGARRTTVDEAIADAVEIAQRAQARLSED